ncbi:hypothetical protein BSKO_00455 [Bryopsis sp. KO-2023]|nr:hypothetical protein BSKO_00455 [Bryopsis sp. KO-2023]
MFVASIVLQVMGCVVYGKYWPMISFILYVFVPMPYLFFGSSDDSGYGGGGGWWVEWGKFLTGFSSVGLIAIPASLFHAGLIKLGALIMEICGAALLFVTLFTYDYFSSRDAGYY